MNQENNPTGRSQTPHQKKGKIPRLFGLLVKDLVSPIILRRTHLLYAGISLLVVALMGYFAWDNFLRQPTGEEMVQEMVDAAGGIDAWNNIRQGQFSRTHKLYSQTGALLETTRETFYFKKTDEGLKLQVRSATADGEEVWVGKDSEGYWASKDKQAVDPILTARGQGMMCDSKFCEPLCASSMAFYRFSMPFKLTDPGIQASLGSADFGGLPFASETPMDSQPLMLDITYDPEVGRDHWRFLVDPKDKLIHKIEYYNQSDLGDARPEEIYWSDHREESGITFSHQWTRYWPNGKVMDEYVYADVDFKTELPDAFFQRPEGHGMLSAKP